MASRKAMKAAIYTSRNSARMAALQRKTVSQKTPWKRSKHLPQETADAEYGADSQMLLLNTQNMQMPEVKERRKAFTSENRKNIRKIRRLNGRQLGRFFPLFVVLLIILFITAFALKG